MVKFLGKQRRIIWAKRIQGFWQEYSHNKIGLVGLMVVVFYAVIALSAHLLTPYDPISDRYLSGSFAKPEWAAIFPQYRDLPRNFEPPANWAVTRASTSINVIESGGDDIVVQYAGEATATIQSAEFVTVFMYPYHPPQKWRVLFDWEVMNTENAEYSLEFYIINPAGNHHILWTSYLTELAPFSTNDLNLTSERLSPGMISERLRNKWPFPSVFTEEWAQGEYKLLLKMKFKSTSSGTCEIHVKDTEIMTYGELWGILGTDSLGRDIFSQTVYGARVSLAVGLLSAFCSTGIGIGLGIVAGYLGGFTDEFLMRMADVLLCLPVLPLLLGLVMLFGSSVWYLVLLIAVFGWMGLSRMVRSRVLSLKEMPFTECAKAAGASRFYIMIKHMLPNVIPIALAAMVLAVPAAILTEAAVSFIGFGDPGMPTWGRMLHYASGQGGFWYLAWWWFLPPGMAITFLTLAFVFIGHAVDEIVNPRLRRRR